MSVLNKYIEPARTQTGAWRLFFSLIIFAAMVAIAQALYLACIVLYAYWGTGDFDIALTEILELEKPDSVKSVWLLLGSFSSFWVATWATGRLLHKQAFATFFAPDKQFHRSPFIKGLILGLAVMLLSVAFTFHKIGDIQTPLSLSQWLTLLIPTLGLIALQVTAEELLFRGYLLQQIAIRLRHCFFWAIIPSILFGLLHYSGDETKAFSIEYVISAGLTGLILATLVWRTGSLWASIGMHLGINVIGLLIIAPQNVISGTQYWQLANLDLAETFLIDTTISVLVLAFILAPTGKWLEPPA